MLTTDQFRIATTGRGGVQSLGDKELLRRIHSCSERDVKVAEALKLVKELGPRKLAKGIEEWNEEDGLLLHRGLVYVPRDEAIQRDIMNIHHNQVTTGHAGRAKTYELLSRGYWWPGMTKFVNRYVDGCDHCNHLKAFPAKPQGPLQPHEVPKGPWQVVTTDIIVKLPEVQGCDSILVAMDMNTKQAHLMGVKEAIDTKGVHNEYLRNVYKLHGLPRVIISDRGPQFASSMMKALNKSLGVTTALSTAYHPQTDGQTEWLNQEIEKFLRMFCSYCQDDWLDFLPLAEFALNSRAWVIARFLLYTATIQSSTLRLESHRSQQLLTVLRHCGKFRRTFASVFRSPHAR